MLTLLIQDLEHVAATVEKDSAAGLRPPVLDGILPCYHYPVASYYCFVDICWFFIDYDCACVMCCCCMYLLCPPMLTAIGFICLRMFLPIWLKRTVAQLWCRTYKGGVVSVLLGVSSHHRALPFLPFPLPSWVLDLHCLFLSA